ncbi:hypothetical protein OnM2_061078, partial [Erysiphe neolycopersici]
MSDRAPLTRCSVCKRNRPLDLFSHPTRTIPYKTCSDCRSRQKSIRQARTRSIFQQQSVQESRNFNRDGGNDVMDTEETTHVVPLVQEFAEVIPETG